MNYYNYFATKKTLRTIQYRKVSLNCKQHSKIRKEHNLWGGTLVFQNSVKVSQRFLIIRNPLI